MTEYLNITSKTELLAEMEQAWATLQAALSQLSDDQMVEAKDGEGWAVKDHITHMVAWERSIVFLLQGKPRHEGLSVDQALYVKGDEDEINAFIREANSDLSAAGALTVFQEVHQQLLSELKPLTDADLRTPYRKFLSEDPGDGDDRSAFDLIVANTVVHYREHQTWIEALVAEPS